MKKSTFLIVLAILTAIQTYNPVYAQNPSLQLNYKFLNGPYGGNISDIQFHPENSDIIYTTSGKGLYKSEDEGITWNAVSKLKRINTVYVGIDTLLIGTDDGLYISIDTGKTWDKIYDNYCRKVFFDAKSNTIIALSDNVIKSTDGGANFTIIEIDEEIDYINCMDVYTSDSLFIYIGTSNNGVYRSFNTGRTWEKINTGITTYELLAIKIYNNNPDIIYLAGPFHICKTTNGGDSWSDIYNGIELVNPQLNDIAIHPTDSNIVYIGGHGSDEQWGLYKTVNGGGSWSKKISYRAMNAVNIDPDEPDKIYIGSIENGFEKSTDAGATFNEYNRGFTGYEYFSLAEALNGDLYVSRTDWGGVYRKLVNDTIWEEFDGFMYPSGRYYNLGTGYISCDPGNGNILYSSIGEGIFKTTDKGENWINSYHCSECNWDTNPIIALPTTPTTIFSFDTTEIIRSIDAGATWERIGLTNKAVSVFKYDSLNTILYVGTSGTGIFKTEDNGENWIDISNNIDDLNINGIAVHDQLIYVTTNLGVSKSADGGNTWENITVDGLYYPEHILLDPNNPDIIIVTSSNDNYINISTDGADTWSVNTSFAESSMISSIIYPSSNKLYISTDNGGVYEGLILKTDSIKYTNISCIGLNDASISVYANSSFSMQYSIDSGKTYQTNSEFIELTAGEYNIAVKDSQENILYWNETIIITEPAIVDLINDTSICEGETITLDAGLFASYLWSNDTTSRTIEINSEGKYIVTVTDENGCISTDSISVNVNPVPIVYIGNDTSIAVNDTLVLSSNAGFSSYIWNTDETTMSITVIGDESNTGEQEYSLQVTDENGCVGSDVILVNITGIDALHDIDPDRLLKVYPNPADNVLNIEFENSGNSDITIEIHSINGMGLYRKTVKDNQIHEQIDLNDFVSGLYILKLSSNEFEKQIEILKE